MEPGINEAPFKVEPLHLDLTFSVDWFLQVMERVEEWNRKEFGSNPWLFLEESELGECLAHFGFQPFLTGIRIPTEGGGEVRMGFHIAPFRRKDGGSGKPLLSALSETVRVVPESWALSIGGLDQERIRFAILPELPENLGRAIQADLQPVREQALKNLGGVVSEADHVLLLRRSSNRNSGPIS